MDNSEKNITLHRVISGMDMEKQVNYKPRIADRLLARKLEGMGAVLIEGPKWCGKTTTAEQQARSILT